MKFLLKFLLIFFILLLTPFICSASVIINEIAWMGTTNSTYDGWIELYNDSDSPIDIGNWSIYGADTGECLNFSDADGYITTIIPAYDYLIYANHEDDVKCSDGINAVDIWDATIGMNDNSPGQVILYDIPSCKDNVIYNVVNCDNEWCKGDKTTKQTMERITDGWQTSSDPNGTPKSPNSTGAVEELEDEPKEEPSPEEPDAEVPLTATGGNIPIANAGNDIIGFTGQEISFDGSKSYDPGGHEIAYSWNLGNGDSIFGKETFSYKYLYPGTYLVTLMVYNGLTYARDIISVEIQNQEITINEFIPNPEGKDEKEEGWIEIYNGSNSIVDISGWQLDDIEGGSKPFTFPENTLIAPKNYLVFPRTITGIALNNASDSVRLLLPQGIVFQEISYEESKQGKSSARTEQGFVWSVPTPGAANIVSIGGNPGINPGSVSYQYETEKEIVKEPLQKYVYNYNPPEQNIEGGYILEEEINLDDELAMIEPILGQGETKGISKGNNNQTILNLILMIGIVILSALVIGVFLTKFLKKST